MDEEDDLIWTTLESIRNDKNKVMIDYLQNEIFRLSNKTKVLYDKIIKDIYGED